MLQIPTCLLPQGADSRKQEQGPNRVRDAGSWEGKERSGKCATTEGLLTFKRMTDLQTFLCREKWKGTAKRLTHMQGHVEKTISRARAAMFHFLNGSDRKSRNLQAA